MGTVRLSSSLRERTPEEAWTAAWPLGEALGITRVTDITALDRIGVPVCIAVRPNARPGSLCVNAGKGLRLEEARIGALMEAIEYAWAEPGRAAIGVERGRLRDVLDGATRHTACLELCPVLGQTLDVDAPCDVVDATDLATGAPVRVPAELVFHPYAPTFGRQSYGTSTNGLASGASVEEATLHALAELIERDAMAFHRIVPQSQPIAPASLPPALAALARRLDEYGFECHVRAINSPFGVPCVAALVSDRAERRMTMRGEGCHPSLEIAAVRAITESLQARLSLIHGGRDDHVDLWTRHGTRTADEIEERYRIAVEQFASGEPVTFDAVPDHAAAATTIADGTRWLVSRLATGGAARVLRVVYTPADYPIQVVRVIVPGLENYQMETRRAGPRLRAFAKRHARGL